jgi:hypothetical protein
MLRTGVGVRGSHSKAGPRGARRRWAAAGFEALSRLRDAGTLGITQPQRSYAAPPGILLVSSVDLPLLHHLLLPGLGGFLGSRSRACCCIGLATGSNSSAHSRSPAGRDAVGALPKLVATAKRERLRFRLAIAPVTGCWEAVGELEVNERLPDVEAERLAFTPWDSGGGIRPVGPLMGIRRDAYRASQPSRGLPASQIP